MKKLYATLFALSFALFIGNAYAATQPVQGKVVTNMIAGGYIYLEVEANNEKVWLAAPEMKIKNGETVEYSGDMVMQNFTSKALKRKFDKIIFVDAVKVIK